MCQTLQLPLKLFECMDRYTQQVFSTLVYYDTVCVKKDQDGCFAFNIDSFCKFMGSSVPTTGAILRELRRLGIVFIESLVKTKGAGWARYRLNTEVYEKYDAIKNSELKNYKIVIPSLASKVVEEESKVVVKEVSEKKVVVETVSEKETKFIKENPDIAAILFAPQDEGSKPAERTINDVKDYDGRRPQYDVKYFLGKVPDVIDDDNEYKKYVNATFYSLNGVKNWTDFKLYDMRLRRVYRAAKKSMSDEWMETKGTKIMQSQLKKTLEYYRKTCERKFKYFRAKYTHLPDMGFTDMYELLNIVPMPLEAYRQHMEEFRQQWKNRGKKSENNVPWSVNGKLYDDENDISEHELNSITRFNNAVKFDDENSS